LHFIEEFFKEAAHALLIQLRKVMPLSVALRNSLIYLRRWHDELNGGDYTLMLKRRWSREARS
jgi:hypothetical protein